MVSAVAEFMLEATTSGVFTTVVSMVVITVLLFKISLTSGSERQHSCAVVSFLMWQLRKSATTDGLRPSVRIIVIL